MIFQIASYTAIVVNQVGQTPIAVQCVAPDPEWRFWINSLAAWIGPLVSGIVSIYVAWKVFHWQGKKDRERWLLDEKASEWRNLIVDSKETVSKIHDIVAKCQIPRSFYVIPPEVQKEAVEEFGEALACSRKLLQGQIFIRNCITEAKLHDLWEDVGRVLVAMAPRTPLLCSPDEISQFLEARKRFQDALYSAADSDLTPSS